MTDAAPLSAETRKHILKKMAALLAAGERKLPTERELAEEVVASYATVRLVMKQLEREGFIRKVRGSGTYLEPAAAELLRQAAWRKLLYFHSPPSNHPERDYGSWLMREVRSVAAERNWRLSTQVVRTHDEFLTGLRRACDSCDAVLYLPPTEPMTIRQLGELSRYDHLPLVVLDAEFGNVSLANVTSDNRHGGMLAARRLLCAGYRKIAVLLSEPALKQQQSRVQGFCEIAEIAGVEPEIINCHVGVNDDRFELTRRALSAYLARGGRPEALFVSSDAGAFGAAAALREHGLEPGRDVALVGFDGIAAGRGMTPSLASVAQPVAGICRTAFDILEHWRPGVRPQHQLSPEFQEGGTLPENSGARIIPVLSAIGIK